MVLNNQYYLVTVGNFNNGNKAMKYLRGIKNDDYVYSDIDPKDFQNYVISTENYPSFFKEKNIDEYALFFKKNYSKPDK